MKVRIVLLAALVLALGCAGLVAAEGKTITVAPWGYNYHSIQRAIDAASSGDVISIYPGFYQESLIITKSLTLHGESPDRVILQGARRGRPVLNIWTSDPGNLIAIALEQDTPITVTLENLQIQGAYWYSSEVECAVYSSTICPDGITVRGRASVTMHNLWVHNNRDNGISLGLNVQATIQNCAIWDNGDDGIHAWLDTEVVILRSTISGNKADGINLQSHYHVFSWLSIGGAVQGTIIGNSITENGRYGIETQSGNEVVSCYGNVIQGNEEGPYRLGEEEE